MGLSGVANHGCDVGGFYGPAPEEELFVRWVQNGIFFPRFSVHSTNTDNTVTEPWMYSGVKHLIRDAIDLRYRMSPYLYSLEQRAHETGLPIMEALFSAFQHDPATYREGVEFMWGDSILVANVVEKGQKIRSVYLPRLGSPREFWYRFDTRERFTPGETAEIPVDLSSIPMLIRSGAIIPMSGNRLTNLMTQKTTDLDLLLAPDTDGSFILYEDDGISNDYLKGDYLKTEIQMKAGEQTLVRFTHTGSYATAVERIHLDVIHREKAPFYVQIDGENLPHFLHRARYEEAERGWYYSQTLKSVQIKYPNPRKDHTVLISFEVFDLIGM
jgi:alpha-glucosidase